MANKFPDKDSTVKYILGEAIDEDFDKKYLSNEEGLEYVMAIEEELILDYIGGTLKPIYRKIFEERFLISPEWRERVESHKIFIEVFQEIRFAPDRQLMKKETYSQKILHGAKSLLTLPKPTDINEPFWSWFWRAAWSYAGVLWSIPALIAGTVFLLGISGKMDENLYNILPFALQALVALVISLQIFVGAKPEDNHSSEQQDRSSIAVHQFWKWWPWVWVTWFFFYFFLTCHAAGLKFTQNPKPLHHLVNHLNSFILLVCHYIIAEKSVNTKKNDTKIESDKKPRPGYRPFFSIESTEEKVLGEKPFNWRYGVFILLAILFWWEVQIGSPDQEENIIYDSFAAILGTVAMAFMVARLTSKLLRVPMTVMALLFLYIGVQGPLIFIITEVSTVYKKLEIGESVRHVLLTIALFGKIFLFATLQWLITSRTLQFYMEQAAMLLDTVPSVRKDWEKRIIEELETLKN
jgi:hypothetical protein